MTITELYIAEFGGLKDCRLTPGEGLTVIEGANESGKSTVMLFIKFMLYGLPKRGQPERARGVSRDGHRAAGSMTVRTEDEAYRIERSFTEGGRNGDRVSVFRVRDGERMTWEGDVGEFLLGVPKEIFENSCHVGQNQCTAPGGKKESAALRNLLSSADEEVDVGRAEKKLEDIRVLYRHKNGKGGRIAEYSLRAEEEKRRLERAEANSLRMTELQEAIERNGEAMRENEGKREQLQRVTEERQRADLLRRFDDMRQKEAEANACAAERKRIQREAWGDAPLPSAAAIARLTMLADSVERAQQEEERKKKAEEAAKTVDWDEEAARRGEEAERTGGAEAVLSAFRRRNSRANAWLAVGAVGILAALFGILLYGLHLPHVATVCLTVGAVAALLGFPLWGNARRQAAHIAALHGAEPHTLAERLAQDTAAYNRRREALAKQNEARQDRETAQNQRAYLTGELQKAMGDVAPHLPATPEAARREAERLNDLAQTLREWEQKETVARELAARERAQLAAYREEELRAAMSAEAEDPAAAADPAEIERQSRFLAGQAEQLKQRDNTLRTEWISRRASEEDPMAVADRLAALKRELAGCEFYFGALTDALTALSQAAESLRGNVTPAIAAEAGRIMKGLSGGRYAALQAGSDLAVSLVSPEGLTTEGDLLSGGTRDAAYLALRMALMRQIFTKETPPLLLDEALSQVDDDRLDGFLALLAQLAEEGTQCLLFTCHRREAAHCQALKIPVSVIPFPQK